MKSLAFALALSFICAVSAEAGSAWTVQRSSGQVAIAGSGAQTISFGDKSDLPVGATITTGASGRVMLTRNKEVMTIGSNAVVTIPADNMFGYTTILQYAGQVAFDVEKRNVRHFEVQTPFMAAVVKGTRFVVSVNRDGAKVSVSRGLVGVANSNGQHADIAPGQSAQVLRGSSDVVITGKPNVKPVAGLKADANDDDNSGKSGKGSNGSSSAGGSGGNGGSNGNGNSGHGNSGHGGGNDDD